MSDDLKRWRVSVTLVDGTSWSATVNARHENEASYKAGRIARSLGIGSPLPGKDAVTVTEIED